MTCLTKIKQMLPSLSGNKQKIALHILEDPQAIRSMSSSQLACSLGVSQSSIVKFCQTIGYRGFTEFRLELASTLSGESHHEDEKRFFHHAITRDDPLSIVAEKLMHEKISALTMTHELNDVDRLERAVSMLFKAKSCMLVGIGSSYLVVEDLAHKMVKIGKHCHYHRDLHVQLTALAHMGPDDLLLIISYRGRHPELHKFAAAAKDQGVPILLVTSYTANPLREMGTWELYSAAEELTFRSSAISSRTAQLAITDLLFMGLVQRDFNPSSEHISRSQRLLKNFQSS